MKKPPPVLTIEDAMNGVNQHLGDAREPANATNKQRFNEIQELIVSYGAEKDSLLNERSQLLETMKSKDIDYDRIGVIDGRVEALTVLVRELEKTRESLRAVMTANDDRAKVFYGRVKEISRQVIKVDHMLNAPQTEADRRCHENTRRVLAQEARDLADQMAVDLSPFGLHTSKVEAALQQWVAAIESPSTIPNEPEAA